MQKKVIITGINGFAGQYLREELLINGYDVYGIDVFGQPSSHVQIFNLLSDMEQLFEMVEEIEPTYIFHLAGQVSVRESWKIPLETLHINVDSSIHILEAVYKKSPQTKLIIIGSAEQYGIVKPQDCPIPEDAPLRPVSPYAISKCTQEEMVRQLAQLEGVDTVFTRTFNHTGPGQRIGFVVTDMASRIARFKKSKENVLYVGNLEAERDFSDIRDSVRAYRLLAEKGKTYEAYNVGSGKSYKIEWILQTLLRFAEVDPVVKESKEDFRPVIMPIFVADCSKIRRDTGYIAEIDFEQTLRDVYRYFYSEGR